MLNKLLTKIRRLRTWMFAHLHAAQKQKSCENEFLIQWTAALKEKPKAFNGLYGGLQRIVDGTAKKPEAIIAEWWMRTRYEWEDQPLAEISRECLGNASSEDLSKWAKLLLNAAVGAGLVKERAETIVLDTVSVAAYVEWNGEEIFAGDTVRIMNPAWYQNGRVVEQGHCMLLENGDDL